MTHTPSPDHHPHVGVLGATGKTGRRVADRLADRGAVVRRCHRGGPQPFDWSDPGTWPAAVDGLDALYVAYSPDLVVPGAVETVGALARVAREAGVARVVLLSGRGEEEARAAEEAVRAELPGLTVVRAAWFVQNLTEGDFGESVRHGELALPVGAVPEPFVDADDIADVAVAALLEPGHDGRTYEVTGPDALTFAELVDAYNAAHGTSVRFTELTPEEAEAQWRAAGLPDEFVWLLGQLFGRLFDGRNAEPGSGVREAMGRAPRPVGAHFAETVSA